MLGEGAGESSNSWSMQKFFWDARSEKVLRSTKKAYASNVKEGENE